jgi:hypothetical protein
MEAQREGTGIALLILNLHTKRRGMGDKGHVLLALIPGKVPGTHCAGD